MSIFNNDTYVIFRDSYIDDMFEIESTIHIAWYGGNMFNIFSDGVEVDVFTYGGVPEITFDIAYALCQDHFDEIKQEWNSENE
jgi:hypothetical protein